jgi:hypothetical protein
MSAPLGQQPSLAIALSIGVFAHWASQVVALPLRASFVQGSSSSQERGQSPSQTSLRSLTRLPHLGSQSLSLLAFAPYGQHPSSRAGHVIGT